MAVPVAYSGAAERRRRYQQAGSFRRWLMDCTEFIYTDSNRGSYPTERGRTNGGARGAFLPTQPQTSVDAAPSPSA